MGEFVLENESELNQMCLQALKKVGRMPDAESLHWLQLLKWGLETGELSVEKDKEYPMRTFLEFLDRQEPSLVMRFLESKDAKDPESERVQVAEQKEWDPVDLAGQILDHLDGRMSAEVGDYPRANPVN